MNYSLSDMLRVNDLETHEGLHLLYDIISLFIFSILFTPHDLDSIQDIESVMLIFFFYKIMPNY